MATTPTPLTLTNIADAAPIVASDHRNNYSSVQTAVNALIAILAAGTSGQVLGSSGGTTVGWQAGSTTYRKATAKTVNTTVAPTDLLNGEITVGAGAMGTTGVARLTCFGDWVNNSGGNANPPRLQLVFGGTTLLDTSAASSTSFGATRGGWRLTAEIMNLGASNAQVSTMLFALHAPAGFLAATATNFVTGEGIYYASNSTAPGGFAALAHGTNPSTAVDTSLAKALVLNVINGSASASYETKLIGALVEIV